VKNLNIPNSITGLRLLLLIPVFILLSQGYNIWAFAVFAVAALLDAVDGYAARKLNQATEFGEYFDFLIDTITVISILVYFMVIGYVVLWNIILFCVAIVFLLFIAAIFSLKKGKAYMPHFTSSKILFIFLNLTVAAFILLLYYANFLFLITLGLTFVYTVPDYIGHIKKI